MSKFAIRVGGKSVQGKGRTLSVLDKYRETEFGQLKLADGPQVTAAIDAAQAIFPAMQALPLHVRKTALHSVARGLEEERELFRATLIAEAGKPYKDADAEVTRAIDTFDLSATEASRVMGHGEYLRLDENPRGDSATALVRRVGRGPIAMISPFNFPLNLVAHKVAPSLAAGCPFVLKPSDRAPLSALLLADLIARKTKGLLPEECASVVPCGIDEAELLVRDPRLKVLSFTGSPAVGWSLMRQAVGKRVVLELGGNAACVVAEDADLDHAAARITFGAFYYSGQTCISVQRVYAHESIYEALKSRLKTRAEALTMGDPALPTTFLGPMIAPSEAERVDSSVQEALRKGASLVCGGVRQGKSFYPATILENVDPTLPLSCREIFGPVCILYPYRNLDEVIGMVNHSDFGLQAGVFTRDMRSVFKMWHHIDVGGLVVNDIPTVRCDAQPYGGSKDSGIGREGPRYAMEEYTERSVLLLQNLDKP